MRTGFIFLALLLGCMCSIDTMYELVDMRSTSFGWEGKLSLKSGVNQYGKDIQNLKIQIFFETSERVRVKITDAEKARWEVPAFTLAHKESVGESSRFQNKYKVGWTKSPFSLQVTRASDGVVLFDSDVSKSSQSPLVFQNQFLQIGSSLRQNSVIYGVGEHVRPLRLDYRTLTIWNIDVATPENLNVYGAHPFYMDLESTGKAHGMFLHNSNGMDIIYSKGNEQDLITFRTLGGILDFYVFVGETPEQVVKQYTDLVGKPYFPPYWALGFHQCRYGYRNVEELESVVENYKKAEIPLETMWTDIDYMDQYKDFTLDPVNFPADKMRKFVDKLHNDKQYYTMIVDPGIKIEKGYPAYDLGTKLGLWTKRPNGDNAVGKVWPDLVHFPDFFHPGSFAWWKNETESFHNVLPFDGMWIDMNELSNFCNGDCKDVPVPPKNPNKFEFNANYPPYRINNLGDSKTNDLFTKTLSADSIHYNGTLEYDVHNMFGYMESWASRDAMESIRGERALIISRSTFSGSGSKTGHWTGDNFSSWRSMYTSIPDILSFQMYGVPLIGADICGFIGDVTEELCARWIQLGAFYPFSRNHNAKGNKPQELYRWPQVAKIGKQVIEIRYSILNYYYTLFYEAHSGIGATVLTPLYYEFSKDSQTYDIDKQFLVGKGIMITPVLEQGATTVTGYFPKASIWYDWYTFKSLNPTSNGWQTLSAPLDVVNIHIRGGNVIPRQAPSMVLEYARKNPFDFVVALDQNGNAKGSLYLDNGKSVQVGENFSYLQFESKMTNSTAGIFTSKVVKAGFKDYQNVLSRVSILGVQRKPTMVNFNKVKTNFLWNSDSQTLTVGSISQDLNKPFVLTWA